MADNLRARFVGDAFKLGKIAFRRRVAVAAENFRQKAARRFRAAVHSRISCRIAADGQEMRRTDGIIKRFEPLCIAEHIPFHARVHGNPSCISRLEAPHFGKKRRDVLRLCRPAVFKRKRAVDADARRIHARRQTGADHLLRHVFAVAKDAVRMKILHGQYHIQFLNQFIFASQSLETSTPEA